METTTRSLCLAALLGLLLAGCGGGAAGGSGNTDETEESSAQPQPDGVPPQQGNPPQGEDPGEGGNADNDQVSVQPPPVQDNVVVPPPPGGLPPGTGTFPVAFTITEPSGIARVADPVTFGLPLAQGMNVTTVNTLGVFEGNVERPAQFRVLSRWGGLPTNPALSIRWLLVDFQADLAPNETRTYYLSNTGSGNASASPLAVDLSDPQTAVVHTGTMDVTLSRVRGNVIDRVVVGGQTVADDPTPARERSGLTLVASSGAVYRAANATPTFVVEEQGPMRVTVRIEAPLVGEVRVVHRLHFYANRAFARAHVQLENHAIHGNFDGTINLAGVLDFDSVAFDVPLALTGTRTFRTEGVQQTGDGPWRVYQGHALNDPGDESQNFSWTLNGAALGQRHPGWVDVRAGGGITAGVRWFWQNYEKALRVAADRVSLELWPAEGVYPPGTGAYRMEGGRRKSHECVLAFHPSAAGDPGADFGRFSAPLVPRAAGLWYCDTLALGMTDPGNLVFSGTGEDARMNTAYARYNQLMRMRAGAAPPDPDRPFPRNILEAKERRYRIGTWDLADWYGWAHFGDFSWGDGYSSNHYDVAGFLLVHYLRLGSRELWDLAEPHVRQAAEWGQLWSIDPNPYVASISFYEKTNHGLFADINRPAASHNWIRRLVLYYWLTGNRAAYDAALFNAEGLWRYFYQGYDISNPASMSFGEWSPLTESRFLTWSIDSILEVWAMTGDTKWRTMAEHLVQCALYAYGQAGHIEGVGNRPPGQNLMACYGSEPLIRFHQASDNATLKAQVLQMLVGILQNTFEADRAAAQGSGAGYLPTLLAVEWDEGNAGPEDYSSIFNGLAASLYAYVGWVTGNAAYLQTARRLWADGVFYPEYSSPYPNRPAVDYATPSTWGWRSLSFPGSEEKVWARQTRAGIPYLWVMRQILP